MFITFEGSEGSGKTSQLADLVQFLCQAGYTVITTREPGGTEIGEQVRSILFDLRNRSMRHRTEVLLFQASRAQLVEDVIRPQLEKGGIVLSDRFSDSTLAYQGYGYGYDVEQLRSVIDFATGGLRPDLILFLDVDVEEGLRRRTRDGAVNRLDIFEPEFYQRVRQGYLEMAHADPQRWVIIDASRPWVAVQEEIRGVVLKRLQAAR